MGTSWNSLQFCALRFAQLLYFYVFYRKTVNDNCLFSLSYSTALVPDAGTDNVYLICVFIRFHSCLLRKVKYSLLELVEGENSQIATEKISLSVSKESMRPDRVQNPVPLALQSDALPTALRRPACVEDQDLKIISLIYFMASEIKTLNSKRSAKICYS